MPQETKEIHNIISLAVQANRAGSLSEADCSTIETYFVKLTCQKILAMASVAYSQQGHQSMADRLHENFNHHQDEAAIRMGNALRPLPNLEISFKDMVKNFQSELSVWSDLDTGKFAELLRCYAYYTENPQQWLSPLDDAFFIHLVISSQECYANLFSKCRYQFGGILQKFPITDENFIAFKERIEILSRLSTLN